MQWAYYWYYSALGCHGHLVRDIQFSLFHHHYLWGHLLWKMNSASFAWLISNFFFIYLTEGHMPGIWSSWKKKWKKKRAWERKSGAVCIRGWMWRWSRSLRPTSLSYCMCHSCPDDIFFPLSYCTQNRATERESFSPQPSWRPPGFSPIVGGCISIFFFFLISWTVGYEINARWRQKQPSLPLGAMRGPPRPPTCGGKGFLFLCVLSQHSYQNWTCRHLWAVRAWCEVRDAH